MPDRWTFTTKRLLVQHWSGSEPPTPEFHADIAKILEPKALAFLPAPLQGKGSHAPKPQKWMQARADEGGVSVVVRRKDNVTIGVLLLGKGDAGAIHIGYLFAPEEWGHGYGSELVQGLVDAAGDTVLKAGADADNIASIQILEKAGFRELTRVDGIVLFTRTP